MESLNKTIVTKEQYQEAIDNPSIKTLNTKTKLYHMEASYIGSCLIAQRWVDVTTKEIQYSLFN